MGRRTWILAAGLLTLLPIADTVLWRVAVGRLESGFDAWAAGSRASNATVTRGKAVPGGWPFAATLQIRNVTISGGETLAPDGVRWFAPSVMLRLSPLHPKSMEIEALGEQHLRVGAGPEAVLTGTRLMVIASLESSDRAGTVDILADRPKLVSGLAWTASADRIRVHAEMPAPGQSGDAGWKFAFSAEAIALPEPVRWPLGSSIARLDFDGTIEGPIAAAQSPAAWATAWRDGGGSLQLQNLVLNWGPLSVTASATLALDDQLQPMGAGTSRVAGYAATLDALAGSGALSRSAATAAKAVLSLLAGPPGDGDPDDVDVPLTLQYRTLTMRQVPLLRLPEIDWPGQ
jgi:hypothetical protein